MMEKPTPLDICCGRGKGRWNSPGNKRFKMVVQENLQRYADAPTKADKSRVVESVVASIQESGGRFVKQDDDDGRWYEIGAMETRSKVAHAIRDHLSSNQKKQQATPGAPVRRNQRMRTRDGLTATAVESAGALAPMLQSRMRASIDAEAEQNPQSFQRQGLGQTDVMPIQSQPLPQHLQADASLASALPSQMQQFRPNLSAFQQQQIHDQHHMRQDGTTINQSQASSMTPFASLNEQLALPRQGQFQSNLMQSAAASMSNQLQPFVQGSVVGNVGGGLGNADGQLLSAMTHDRLNASSSWPPFLPQSGNSGMTGMQSQENINNAFSDLGQDGRLPLDYLSRQQSVATQAISPQNDLSSFYQAQASLQQRSQQTDDSARLLHSFYRQNNLQAMRQEAIDNINAVNNDPILMRLKQLQQQQLQLEQEQFQIQQQQLMHPGSSAQQGTLSGLPLLEQPDAMDTNLSIAMPDNSGGLPSTAGTTGTGATRSLAPNEEVVQPPPGAFVSLPNPHEDFEPNAVFPPE